MLYSSKNIKKAKMKNIKVIDLFCGMGGFSEGAKLSGCDVIVAVDFSEIALQVHELNHPETIHLHLKLGEESPSQTWRMLEKYLKRKKTDHLHIHGSPPCQNLSAANPYKKLSEGMHLVNWYLELVKVSQCDSWSIEQVNHSAVRKALEAEQVRFAVLNFAHFGVSQSRTRIIGGEGFDVSRFSPTSALTLRTVLRKTRRLTAAELDSLGVRSFGEFKKASVRNLYDPAPTVLAARSNFLVNLETLKVVSRLSVTENLLLQGFRKDYQLGNYSKTACQKLIGNALPPAIAEQIVKSLC